MAARAWAVIHRALWLMLIAVVIIMTHFGVSGLPKSMVRRIERAASTDDIAVTIDGVSYAFPGRLAIGSVKAYPRSDATAPIIESSSIRARLSPSPFRPWKTWISSVSAGRLVITDIPSRGGTNDAPPTIPSFDGIGLSVSDASVFGTQFRDVSTVASCTNNVLQFEKISGNVAPPHHPPEMVGGEAAYFVGSGEVTAACEGKIDPTRLIPLFRGLGVNSVARELSLFKFHGSPAELRAQFTVNISARDATNSVVMSVATGSCLYRDVPVTSAKAMIRAGGTNGWNFASIEQLKVERQEGVAKGDIHYDLGDGSITISATSSLDPKMLVKMIDLPDTDALKYFSFGPGVEMTAKGCYSPSTNSTRHTSIEGFVRVPILRFFRKYKAEDVRGRFLINEDRYLLPEVRGKLYSGDFRGSVLFTKDSETGDLLFSAQAQIDKAEITPLVMAISGKDLEGKGLMNSEFCVRGNITTNTLPSLDGQGSMGLKDATIYKMPLFAGFTEFMARNVPGVNFLVSQDNMRMTYDISNNGLHIQKFEIDGGIFSITGDGDYWFTDDLDIGMKISLLSQKTLAGKILKYPLYPVSKLFELEVRGPINDPKWSPTTLALRARSSSKRHPGQSDAPAQSSPEPAPPPGDK